MFLVKILMEMVNYPLKKSLTIIFLIYIYIYIYMKKNLTQKFNFCKNKWDMRIEIRGEDEDRDGDREGFSIPVTPLNLLPRNYMFP